MLYGLGVASDAALPGLAEAKTTPQTGVVCHIGSFPADVDLRQFRQERPIFVSTRHGPNGDPLLIVWQSSQTAHYCFQYCEGLTFLIDGGGRAIWACWSDPVTLEDATAFLLGQIFAFLLHLRGLVCLHASAVAVEGTAVLFAGDPGMGKSSTAAAFAERGCPILADDVAAVKQEPGGRLLVVPGFPRVCLWPDSTEFIYGAGSAGRYPRVQPDEEKRLVRLDDLPGKFQTQPVPLGAIYLLAPRTAEGSAPRIEAVEDAHRLIGLLTNGYVSLALGREQRAQEFHLLGEIAQRALVRRLVPSSDPQKLNRLCELVVDDVRASTGSSLAGRVR